IINLNFLHILHLKNIFWCYDNCILTKLYIVERILHFIFPAKKPKNSQQLISTIDDFDFYTTQLIRFYSLTESLLESELEFESGVPGVNKIEIDIIYRFIDLICMIIIIYHRLILKD
ncbi:hypothetical protein BpHYR1_026259, partial [Brachionus plicatilis]